MTDLQLDDALIKHGLDELCAADPALAAARARWGDPPLRRWPQGFETLVDVIIGQQVSSASAAAIKARLRGLIDPLTPGGVLGAPDDTLRAAGLSRQKMLYLRDLAAHVDDRRLDLAALPTLDEDAVIAQLIAIKGIGRWTAEIYLLFALGRPDIWPADDLAIAIAFQHLRGLPARPTTKSLRALAASWQPWRGVAAHALWAYYPHYVAAAKAAVATSREPEKVAS